MSEFKENVNEMDAADVVAQAQARVENPIFAFGDPTETREKRKDPFLKTLERMESELRAEEEKLKKKLRQKAMDRLYLGLLCGVGVVSLVGASVSGVWEPVALGLGICLSAAAGILVYQARVELRK